MSERKTQIKAEYQKPVADMAAKLLPVIARKKAVAQVPAHAGASFFYEIDSGWETDILKQDADIHVVENIFEFEDAFTCPDVPTILIPAHASITKTIAVRVCKRHGMGKTVFYESAVINENAAEQKVAGK